MDYSMDILARLQAGEKVEDIAAELTESINAANEKYAAEKKAAEEKAKAAAHYDDKKIAIEQLVDAICDILEIWDVDSNIVQQIEDISDEDIESIVELIDESLPFLTKYLEMQIALQDLASKKANPVAKKAEVASDPVESFLNKFVR